MEQLTTAKELFDKMLEENDECTTTEMMIEFARIHREAILKRSYQASLLKISNYMKDGQTARREELLVRHIEADKEMWISVSEESIMNCYPVDKIK